MGFENFPCNECSKQFRENNYLKEHIRRCHSTKKWLCYHCSFAAPYKSTLKSHVERSHLVKKKRDPQPFTCTLCKTFISQDRKVMTNHYINDHGLHINPKILEFPSVDEFEHWKCQLERDETCKFVRRTGVKKFQTKSLQVFTCFRDGFYKKRGLGKRRLKQLGSNKVNGVCPAYIKRTLDCESGIVRVEYVNQHVGHLADISRLTLSKSEKDEIAKELAADVPADIILDGIRQSMYSNNLERLHLTTRKDLQNLKRDYNLQGESVLHSKDSTSVHARIIMMQNDSNTIRFYKPQNTINPDYPELRDEDFVLVIANNSQLEMLETYGTNCICFDSTGGTNQFGFELTTILVPDEMLQGFPCAYVLSNRSDDVIISLFVKVLKTEMQCVIETNILMSDNTDEFYKGWCKMMPAPRLRLFCTWHVDQAWQSNLSKIRDLKKRAVAYRLIRTAMEETEKEAFPSLLRKAMTCLESDSDFTQFREYFVQMYSFNAESWALCYRRNCGLNTDMHLESVYSVTKHFYLKVKKMKRLDKVICALMQFTREKLFDQVIVKFRGEITSEVLAIRERHETSVNMDCIIIPTSNGWNISSQSHFETYEITKQVTDCDCNLRCEDCNYCIHSFWCSCIDSMVQWNFCKHIHYLISSLKQGSSESTKPPAPREDVREHCECIIVEEVSTTISETEDLELEKMKKIALEEYAELIAEAPTVSCVQAIRSHLEPLRASIEAIHSGVQSEPSSTN